MANVYDENCLFCKIAKGDIPSKKVYEDDLCYAFYDIDPQAPVHVLIIPKKHIASLDEIKEEDADLMAYILEKVKDIAKLTGLDNGYRLVVNCGADGMQTVKHLHFHLLGKRSMKWPPG